MKCAHIYNTPFTPAHQIHCPSRLNHTQRHLTWKVPQIASLCLGTYLTNEYSSKAYSSSSLPATMLLSGPFLSMMLMISYSASAAAMVVCSAFVS